MEVLKIQKIKGPSLRKSRKGQVTFGSLPSVIILLGIAAVIGVVMAILVQTIRDDETTAASAARNVTDQGLSFFNNISSQFGLLGTVIGLVLVVSVVIAAFRFRGGGGGL